MYSEKDLKHIEKTNYGLTKPLQATLGLALLGLDE